MPVNYGEFGYQIRPLDYINGPYNTRPESLEHAFKKAFELCETKCEHSNIDNSSHFHKCLDCGKEINWDD
jgi:hypothetical protein